MKPIRTFILCFGMFPLFLPNDLHAQYHIRASVLGGGGATASNGNHRLASTVGQIFIGSAQGGNFRKQVGFWRSAHLLTPVEKISELIPTEYRLDQNFPNPFNPSTTIRFAVKERSHITLVVFNILGQTVSTLINEELAAGEYETHFSPGGLASGLYVYRISTNGFVQSRRMLLLK